MMWWYGLAVLSFAAVIFAPQTVASQRIYRCVDADGQVSFSNDPEQCVKAGRPTPAPGSGSNPAAEKTEAAPNQGGGERDATGRNEGRPPRSRLDQLPPETETVAVRNLSDDEVLALGRFKQLRTLDFFGGWGVAEARLTDGGVKNFASLDLPELRMLHLGPNRFITDEALSSVVALKQVKYLGLAAIPRLTDKGLAVIAQMKWLTDLDLRGNPGITDSGLVHLEGMKNLKTLLLDGSPNVTEGSVARLRRALPGCKVQKNDEWWDLMMVDAGRATRPPGSGSNPAAAKTEAAPSQGRGDSSSTMIKGCVGFVFFLRFSPDGRELARTCQFGPVVLFDTAGYKKARTFSVGMRMVAYSRDGSRIATAEGIDGARVWDAAVPGTPVKPSPSWGEIGADEFSLLDSPLQVLQAPSGDRKQTVHWTEFSPDGKRLVTTHANGHVKVWKTNSWTVEDDLTPTTGEVPSAAFAADSKTLVIGDDNGVLHQWSFEKRAETKTWRAPSGAVRGRNGVWRVVFAPDGKSLVTIHASESGSSAVIWDTARWTTQVKPGFGSAAFSKDGKVLALGDSNIELIDTASWKPIRTIKLSGPFALAFSPDGRTLAVGGVDGLVRLVRVTQ